MPIERLPNSNLVSSATIFLTAICACSGETYGPLPDPTNIDASIRDSGSIEVRRTDGGDYGKMVHDAGLHNSISSDSGTKSNTATEFYDSGTADAGNRDTSRPSANIPALSLTTSLKSIEKHRVGTDRTVVINLRRRGGLKGAITIEAIGLPAGVALAPLTIQREQSTAPTRLSSLITATAGLTTHFSIRATSVDHPEIAAEVSAELFTIGRRGDLDLSFGTDGLVTLNPSEREHRAPEARIRIDDHSNILAATHIVTPDHKVFAGLTRLLPSGSIDEDFGTLGSIPHWNTKPSRLQFGPLFDDGSLIVVRSYDGQDQRIHVMHRLTDAGTPKPLFGTGGDLLLNGISGQYNLVQNNDGLLYVRNGDLQVTRYGETGAIDSTYALETRTHAMDKTWSDSNDGTFAATYQRQDDPFELAHYLSDGSLDTDFGSNGFVTWPVVSTHRGTESISTAFSGVAILGDGSVLALSYSGIGNYPSAPEDEPDNTHTTIRRLNTDGTLDPTYGVNGVVTYDGADLWVMGLRAAADGTAILRYANGGSHVLVLNPNGYPDARFGTDGLIESSTFEIFLRDIAVDHAGSRFVVAWSDQQNLYFRRYWL